MHHSLVDDGETDAVPISRGEITTQRTYSGECAGLGVNVATRELWLHAALERAIHAGDCLLYTSDAADEAGMV